MIKHMNKIKPQYDSFSRGQYEKKINSPSKNPEYFWRFHAPLVERALQIGRTARPVLIDVACGHANELMFFDTSKLSIIGLDISSRSLLSAKKELPQVRFLQADVREGTPLPMAADIAIAVNAVVYAPGSMLSAIRESLVPWGRAAVNFRNAENALNKPFYEFYLKDNASIGEIRLAHGSEEFTLTELDYRECGDEKIRSLDRQIYFRSVDDMVRFIEATGLKVVSHDTFHFPSPSNPDNEIDVFTLEK